MNSLLPLLLSLAGLAAYFAEHASRLVVLWDSDDYSYCYVAPVLAMYFAWGERDRILASAGGSPGPGYAALALAGMSILVGRLGALETLVYLGMWLSVAGATLSFLGSRAAKSLVFPLLILLFAIPAPAFVTRLLTFNLKLLSSELAVQALHLLSVPAFRDGNILELSTMRLQVVDACSGLRFFFPTILISLVIGHLFNRTWWAKLTIFLVSPPTAILGNVLRLVVTGVLVRYVDPSLAEGFFHDFSGIIIYMFSILALSLIGFGLRLAEGRLGSHGRAPRAMLPEAFSNAWLTRPAWPQALAVALLIGSLVLAQDRFIGSQIIPVRKTFADFPMRIGAWNGERKYLDKETLAALWADDYVFGSFTLADSGNVLHLLIPYYQSQTTEHTAHAPVSCMLGGGWDLEKKAVLGPSSDGRRDFSVQQMVLAKGNSRILSNFWFEQRGRGITSEYRNKLFLIMDAVSLRRTDGALVRAELYLLPRQTVEEGQHLLDAFLAEVRGLLPDYIPGQAAGLAVQAGPGQPIR